MTNFIDQTIKDIKDLKIQGATNIARQSLTAISTWSNSKTNFTFSDLKAIAVKLKNARPTEPLTRNCLGWFLDKVKHDDNPNYINIAQGILTSLSIAHTKIVNIGVTLIKNRQTILTHCHSSTVVSILSDAAAKGLQFKVILTETRPRLQGHITAKQLLEKKIDTTMITDSQAAYIVSKQDKEDIDLIIVGADAIDHQGSALNKVGSYGISLSAKKEKIPFYVSATLLKYYPKPTPIELRSPDEIWKDRPVGLKISNLAFDKIPFNHISYFITEHGLVKPTDIKTTVIKFYPWIDEYAN